jgi:hypothetical protein
MQSKHVNADEIAFDPAAGGESAIGLHSATEARRQVAAQDFPDKSEKSPEEPEPMVSRFREAEEAARRPRNTILKSILNTLKGMATPATLGVLVSLPFALVQPLKALVWPVEGWSGSRIANAPDGLPPLTFFYDVSPPTRLGKSASLLDII